MVMNPAFEQSLLGSILSLFLCALCIAGIPRQVEETDIGQSICFILGEDKVGQKFYTLATDYFTENASAQTNQLIKHIRSIEELVLFLNNQENDKPWDRIELVVHGNVWSGLSVKIMDGGDRAYPKELLRAIVMQQLPSLAPHVIDTMTQINVWGCGIGTNPIMNIALKKCFTDSDGKQAKVNASKKFVVFKRQVETGQVTLIKANYWPYFFKRGYRPSDSHISKAMAAQYPEADLNFTTVMSQQSHSTSYEEEFHIPVSWTVIYKTKESRPDVTSQESKLSWIRSQSLLMAKIKDLQIPFDRYQWTVNKIIHTDETGESVPAIKAIGMSTVLCILDETGHV